MSDYKQYLHQICSMTDTELLAFHNILQFNLRGIFIGDRSEIQDKLSRVQAEMASRGLQESN